MAHQVKVWDPLVRLFHWSLVLSVALAWLSADSWHKWHQYFGYVAGGLIALRLIWGLVGTRYARFTQFVRGPFHVLGYARDVATGRERRYLGHNPLGALMVIALLAAVAGTTATGWMMTTDAYWGEEWVEEVHEVLANFIPALVALHVAGVVFASLRHRENLIGAMFTGRKSPPQTRDIA